MYCKSAWSNDGTTDRIDRGSTVNRNSLTHERCPTQSHIHTQYSAERIASPYQAAFTVGIGIDSGFAELWILRNTPLLRRSEFFQAQKFFQKWVTNLFWRISVGNEEVWRACAETTQFTKLNKHSVPSVKPSTVMWNVWNPSGSYAPLGPGSRF